MRTGVSDVIGNIEINPCLSCIESNGKSLERITSTRQGTLFGCKPFAFFISECLDIEYKKSLSDIIL